jgi:hypothetical protein
VKVGVDGFAMTAALCQESRAKNGLYLLIELLSAGSEPKKSLVAPHDTTFYAFWRFFVRVCARVCCLVERSQS